VNEELSNIEFSLEPRKTKGEPLSLAIEKTGCLKYCRRWAKCQFISGMRYKENGAYLFV
jgi:hypothetical protein